MQDIERPSGEPDSEHSLVERPNSPVSTSENRPRTQSLELKVDNGSPQSDAFDLRHYWQVLRKRKWTVLSAFAIVVATVLVGTLLATPIYRASTTIEIDKEADQVVQVQGMNDSGNAVYSDPMYLKTQYSLLQSTALARRVASRLHLADDPAYQRLGDSSPLSKLFGAFSPGAKKTRVTLSSDAESAMLGSFISNGLSVDPVQGTQLVMISFDSPDPGLSAKVVGAVADNFIAANLEHTYNASAYARTYLEGRIAQLKQKLTESETHLVDIATQQRLFLDSTGKPTLTTASLDAMTLALVQAQDNRAKAESRWKLTSGVPNNALPGDMLTSSIVETLRQQRATLSADYQQKLTVYKPNYPLMQALKGQIDELDKQIAVEYSGVKLSAKSEFVAAQLHENMAQKQLDELKNQALDQQHRAIEYSVALRDVNTNQLLYDGLLQRYKEIGIAGGVTSNNMSIVDTADIPNKIYRPNLLLNMALGIFLGLVVGVGLALLFEYLDDTIKSPDDVEKLLGLAVLGVIPRLKGTTPIEVAKDPRSAFCEAYRSVRTALQFATGSGVPRSLLITSATPGEGKTTTAMTLALNFAQLGKRVLLIDADLRNPSLHRAFGLDNSNGLSNFLSGAINPQEAIQTVPDTTLQVMTSGPLPPDPAELLAGSKMLSLLTVAMAKYDQVVIDAPPTIGIADALIIAHIAAGTLLVVDSGGTRRGVAQGAVKRLLSARAHMVGGVMTKFEAELSSYGYGYGSYTYYTYGADKPKLIGK
jgi:capsular exopolysaccharide synthesis family protein